ncbi:MAG: hypothetical protein AAF490_08940 [Chloroflexota bacterium]
MTIASTPELRPLSMGQLLDRAIRLYRNNFWTFTGIVALTQIPATILNIILTVAIANYNAPEPTFGTSENEFLDAFLLGLGTVPPWSITASLAIGFLGFLLTMFAYSGIIHSVAQNYLGKDVDLSSALGYASKNWLSLFWPLVLAFLFGFLIAIYWIFVPLLGWLTGLGMFIFWGSAAAFLVIPIVILEKKRSFEAIARAWELGRKRFWWLILFNLILLAFSWIIIQGPSLLIATAVSQFGGFGLVSIESQIIQQIVNTLLSAIYLPLQLTCYTLMYFDLRVRFEGLDLSLMAVSDDEGGVEVDQLLQNAPKADPKMAPTGEEWLWFLMLSIIIYLLIVIFYAIIFAVLIASLRF